MGSFNSKNVGTSGCKKIVKSKTMQPSSKLTPKIESSRSKDFPSVSRFEDSTSTGKLSIFKNTSSIFTNTTSMLK